MIKIIKKKISWPQKKLTQIYVEMFFSEGPKFSLLCPALITT